MLSLSRKSAGLGKMSKEVNDLRVAYEITQERNRRLRADKRFFLGPSQQKRRSQSSNKNQQAASKVRSISAHSAGHNSYHTLSNYQAQSKPLLFKRMDKRELPLRKLNKSTLGLRSNGATTAKSIVNGGIDRMRDLRTPMMITSEQSLAAQRQGLAKNRSADRSPFKYIIQQHNFNPDKTWEQQLRQSQTTQSVKYFNQRQLMQGRFLKRGSSLNRSNLELVQR